MEKYDKIDDYFSSNGKHTSYSSGDMEKVPQISKQIKKTVPIRTKFDVSEVEKITNVNFPETIGADAKYNSKYKIKLSYKKKNEQKGNHSKTVFFGRHGRYDYIEHKNTALRDDFIRRNKCKPKSEFEPAFWDIFLLNGKEDDLNKSFVNLKNKILN